MFDSTFKTRKQLNEVLGNDKTPFNINCFNVIGHCMMILLFILALIEYIVTRREFSQINENIKLINLSYERIAEVENVVSKSRNIVLLQLGINSIYDKRSNEESLKYWKTSISSSLDGIEKIQNSL